MAVVLRPFSLSFNYVISQSSARCNQYTEYPLQYSIRDVEELNPDCDVKVRVSVKLLLSRAPSTSPVVLAALQPGMRAIQGPNPASLPSAD